MNSILQRIVNLVAKGEVLVSDHGYDELAADAILVRDVIAGVPASEIVEDYPSFAKGPCVLVLEMDAQGKPFHAVWGIPKGATTPAVLITAYRPAADRWSADFKRRKT